MTVIRKLILHLRNRPYLIFVYLFLIDIGVFAYAFNFHFDFAVQWGTWNMWLFIIAGGLYAFVFSALSDAESGDTGDSTYYEQDDDEYLYQGSHSAEEARKRINEDGETPDMSNPYDANVVFDNDMARLTGRDEDEWNS